MSNSNTPLYIEVHFTEISATPVRAAEHEASLCASGYVFLGRLQLHHGAELLELAVQTGGWMSAESPFARESRCPASPEWGSYTPPLYPDTAFPALPGETSLGTLRTGKRRGFRVPDPPGTGRSALMVHDSVRFGSEGCISTPPGEAWENFCAVMHNLHTQGVQSIPLRVIYDCPPPEPLRCPTCDPAASNSELSETN